MTARTASTSPRTYARIAGILYLLIFVVGPLAFFVGRTSVYVPGDPTATVDNLMASESMFRLGMVAETVIVLVEIVMSGIFYALLRPVSRPLALASSLARFGQAVLQAVNLLTAVPALLVLTAYALPEERERARAAGCDGYITKPIDIRCFPDQVRQHLDSRAGEKAA